MANEIQVRASVSVRKDNLVYQSQPTVFQLTMEGVARGPAPGLVTVDTGGTSIDFTWLDSPGIVWVMNLDSVNYVEVGAYDPETNRFLPLFEVGPGEMYPWKLSRELGKELKGTGTGTSETDLGTGTVKLYMRAQGGPCDVRVEAFER